MKRYEVRFSNGYWKSFDTHFYCSVQLHWLKGQAEEYVAHLNKD